MQGDDSHDDPRADDLHDELRVEDLDDPQAEQPRSLALIRRLYSAWNGLRSPRGRLVAARVAAVGLTLVLALTLVAMTGDTRSQFAGRVSLGADPVAVTASQAAPMVSLAGQPPTQVGASDWQQVTLPNAPGTSVRSMVPSPTEPSTLYACTGAAISSPFADPPTGPIVVWRTHDAGQHWRSLPLPPQEGTWCELSVAADAPQRVALFSGSDTDYPPCDGNRLYLSDDGGDSWKRIAAPRFGPVDAFTAGGCIFWPTAHHLYFLYSYERGSRLNPEGRGPQLSILARSDDEGRSWVRADDPLGDNALFFVSHIGNEDTLAAGVMWWKSHVPTGEVWETSDAGTTWHKVSVGAAPILITLPIPGSHEHLPIYAPSDDQVPSYLFRDKVAQLTGTSPATEPLPPLPVSGASPDRMGVLQVAQETHDGRLLAFGADPHVGVPTEAAMNYGTGLVAQWLWIWDPRVGRWLVWPSPLPVASTWGEGGYENYGATWTSGGAFSNNSPAGTYLWVRFDGFRDNGNVAYRVFVPDAPPGQLTASA